MVRILGYLLFHDSAATLIDEGRIVAADKRSDLQEKSTTQIIHLMPLSLF